MAEPGWHTYNTSINPQKYTPTGPPPGAGRRDAGGQSRRCRGQERGATAGGRRGGPGGTGGGADGARPGDAVRLPLSPFFSLCLNSFTSQIHQCPGFTCFVVFCLHQPTPPLPTMACPHTHSTRMYLEVAAQKKEKAERQRQGGMAGPPERDAAAEQRRRVAEVGEQIWVGLVWVWFGRNEADSSVALYPYK